MELSQKMPNRLDKFLVRVPLWVSHPQHGVSVLVPEGLVDHCALGGAVGSHEIDREVAGVKLTVKIPTLALDLVRAEHDHLDLIGA